MSDQQIAQWCFIVFLTYIMAEMAHVVTTMLIMLWQDMYVTKEVTD